MIKIEGLEKVIANLNNEIKKIENGTRKGLLRAAIVVQRDTEKTPPLTPVDTGNLRYSFIKIVQGMDLPPRPPFSDIGHDGKLRPGAAQKASEDWETTLAEVVAEVARASYPLLIMGYTSNYAAAVHENMDPDVTWSRPQSGPKFFEQAIARNVGPILRVIREEAQVR